MHPLLFLLMGGNKRDITLVCIGLLNRGNAFMMSTTRPLRVIRVD